MQVLPPAHPGYLGVKVTASPGSSPPPRAALFAAVVVMGGTALLAQVLLTRELLAVFLGNELSIALVLAVWLVSVSAGSTVGARLAARLSSPAQALGWSQIAAAALLPCSLVLARRLPPPTLPVGEVIGPGGMLLISLEALGAVAVLAGIQFVLAAASAQRLAGHDDQRAVSGAAVVYALEALGAALAGIAFHLYLAQQVMPLATAAAAGVLNLLCAIALLRPRPRLAGGGQLAVAAALMSGLVWVMWAGARLELATFENTHRWSVIHPIAFLPSKYGALLVTQRDQQIALYQSGVALFTSEDDYRNEATAHLALLEHPHPREVLLIGGAASGLAGEILKHPVERLDCVELDPRVIELPRRWLPKSLVAPLTEGRTHMHVGDGRLLVRGERARYDVVISNLPDPSTAAINRFYTREFFQEVKQALRPDGILCLGITGSEVHLSGSLLYAVGSLDRTLSVVFPTRLLVPGDRTLFLAGGAKARVTSDWHLLCERMNERKVAARFVNEQWLRDALLPFRAELMEEALARVHDFPVNTDLNPISYYYQSKVWLEQVAGGRVSAYRRFPRAAWWGAGVMAVALLLWGLVRAGRAPGGAVLIGIAAAGAFGLVVEVLALLAFQSACGYLYHALGLLIALFMVGLGAGAALAGARRAEPRQSRRVIAIGLGTAALACLLLPNLLGSAVANPAVAPIALGALLLLSGSLVGGLFPIATSLYRHRRGVVRSVGAVYAADLAGSAGAALVVGAVAVPLLGVGGTCLVTAAALALAMLLLLVRRPA